MTRARRRRNPWKRAWGELRFWLGRALGWSVWLAIFAALAFILWQRDLLLIPIAAIDPSSDAAFHLWIKEDPARAQEFAEFEAFLAAEGVGEVVPAWQLARIDEAYAAQCDLPVWVMPPRALWPSIVPALALVRDHVIPTLGPVAVASSFRTPELNACARGASGSRHLAFAAVDLVPVNRPQDLSAHYANLCAMQARAGRGSAMGLGAYYDPADPVYNPAGKFHIDADGYRSWGRTYRANSSPCGRVGY